MSECLDLDRLGLSLVPGPLTPPPAELRWTSVGAHAVEPYDPASVACVLLSISGALLVSDGDGDWHKWGALWDLGGATIAVGFSLFDIEPIAWGGSSLSGRVDASLLLAAWEHIRKELPAVWMHDGECNLYTPETFATTFNVG